MSKTIKHWKVLERGELPDTGTHDIEFGCPHCHTESMLPVIGLPICQAHAGIVFDIGNHAMPRSMRCPHCKSTFELEARS